MKEDLTITVKGLNYMIIKRLKMLGLIYLKIFFFLLMCLFTLKIIVGLSILFILFYIIPFIGVSYSLIYGISDSLSFNQLWIHFSMFISIVIVGSINYLLFPLYKRVMEYVFEKIGNRIEKIERRFEEIKIDND